MPRRARRVRRRDCRRSCASSAAIGRRAIITMHSPARVARDSFGGVWPKMRSTAASLDVPAKWTCTCDASARSADWRSAWPWACDPNALCPRISVRWSGARRRRKRRRTRWPVRPVHSMASVQTLAARGRAMVRMARMRMSRRRYSIWWRAKLHSIPQFRWVQLSFFLYQCVTNRFILQLLPDDILAECQARKIPPLTFNQLAVIYKLIWYQDGYEQPSEEDLKRIMVGWIWYK